MPREFVPVPPPGFDIASSFNGVTTAVGQGGVPRIRYQRTGVQFPSSGLVGFLTREALKSGIGDEVALGSLHTRIKTALMLVGSEPEAGLTERLDKRKPNGLVLGRYKDRDTNAEKYGAMALVKARQGRIEILVTECETESRAREVVGAALAPYV
jgi:hypothetical protein